MLTIIQLLKQWVDIKIVLAQKKSNLFFKEKEIWWCHLGMNLGEEEYGKGIKFTRPVLIFKKFTSNSFAGLPLTSKKKAGTWYAEINFHQKSSWVLLNQVRTLDKTRLISRIVELNNNDFLKTKERFIELYRS